MGGKTNHEKSQTTRRTFIKTAGPLAAGLSLASASPARGAEETLAVLGEHLRK